MDHLLAGAAGGGREVLLLRLEAGPEVPAPEGGGPGGGAARAGGGCGSRAAPAGPPEPEGGADAMEGRAAGAAGAGAEAAQSKNGCSETRDTRLAREGAGEARVGPVSMPGRAWAARRQAGRAAGSLVRVLVDCPRDALPPQLPAEGKGLPDGLDHGQRRFGPADVG